VNGYEKIYLGDKMDKPLVSICIPHWQVRELATICLRAIRRFTRSIPIEVLVVDNGSQDDSLDYLRNLPWIRLIERGTQTPEHWVRAFMTALDVGFEHSLGDYFIIMHTDTLIKRPDWLEYLLDPLYKDAKCAASGSWKLEPPRPLYDFIKKITDTKKLLLWMQYRLLRDQQAYRQPKELCPRDYCALYRSDPIRRFGMKFAATGPQFRATAAERMYVQLKENGYHAHVFEPPEMMLYMEHLAHATAGLRPDQRRLNHSRAQRKSEKKIRRFFDLPLVRELSQDISLDL
jgi:glycosyltransferase involved in cell wall biosynthesis